MSSVHLRFVHVNDVYLLNYFPYLATAIDVAKKGSEFPQLPPNWPVGEIKPSDGGVKSLPKPTKLSSLPSQGTLSGIPDFVVADLPGDFLSPSLLSGVDKGVGMIQVLNATFAHADKGYVCFGNHEGEVGPENMTERIKESQFTWINTNIPGYNAPVLPESDILELKSKDGSHTRKVGFIGLCVKSSAMSIPSSAFATSMPSFVGFKEAADQAYEKLKDKVDCVIPLTHLESYEDLELLKTERFPLILGAHDHDVQVPTHNGRPCVKAGAEGEFCFIVDVIWKDSNTPGDKPEVSYQLIPTTLFSRSEEIQQLVEKHLVKVEAMEKMILFREAEDDFLPLSSEGSKRQLTTLASLLLGSVRQQMSAECAIMNGGGLRLQQLFDRPTISYSDLRKLFPWDTDIVVVPLPGKVLESILNYTRAPVHIKGEVESNSYIQHDKHVVTNYILKSTGEELTDEEQLAQNREDLWEKIEGIGGRTFHPEETYRVALPYELLNGLDKVEPLIKWAKENEKLVIGAKGDGVPIKVVLMNFYMQLLWRKLPTFDEIDTDKSGHLSADEVKQVFVKVFGQELYGDEIDEVESFALENMVDALLGALDKDGDMQVSRKEYEIVFGFPKKKKLSLVPK